MRSEEKEDGQSTDPDYDDAEAIMKILHSLKRGARFTVTLTVVNTEAPSSWALPIGPGEEEPYCPLCNRLTSDKRRWCHMRIFSSQVNGSGNYEQIVEHGSDRVGGPSGSNYRDTDNEIIGDADTEQAEAEDG